MTVFRAKGRIFPIVATCPALSSPSLRSARLPSQPLKGVKANRSYDSARLAPLARPAGFAGYPAQSFLDKFFGKFGCARTHARTDARTRRQKTTPWTHHLNG